MTTRLVTIEVASAPLFVRRRELKDLTSHTDQPLTSGDAKEGKMDVAADFQKESLQFIIAAILIQQSGEFGEYACNLFAIRLVQKEINYCAWIRRIVHPILVKITAKELPQRRKVFAN